MDPNVFIRNRTPPYSLIRIRIQILTIRRSNGLAEAGLSYFVSV